MRISGGTAGSALLMRSEPRLSGRSWQTEAVESGLRMQLLAHLVGRERQEVNLDIGRRQPRTGLEERARRAGRDGERSLAKRRILHAGHDAGEQG